MHPVDLHCHSTASDGVLAPAEVVRRAYQRGVRVLALTDHDALEGLAPAREAARACGITLIDGVEVSVTWRGQTIHVVGLGIDPSHPVLGTGLTGLREGRRARARRMAAELERLGIEGSLEGAYAHARNPDLIGRTHFARFLVERGVASDVKSVFQRYLTPGKPGYVPHVWASLEEAIRWITASGGVAVLAHPGRYRLSSQTLEELLTEFRDHGGSGIEVVTGSHSPDEYGRFARFADRFGLAASAGSDFHGPGEGALDLGALPPLPEGCRPVWNMLGLE
ncbi:MAG: phosphatase [Azospira oryzae]|nr:MAG: phosphatase [Azospira oryzae]PZP77018.1 MAG: phosphatase [Azospira oryzae]